MKLFTPIKVGDVTLQHRVVMAPLTRERADEHHVPTPMMAEYYAQRASSPGTMLISEATLVAPQAGGRSHVPGLWCEEQVAGWQRVTSTVHAQGSYIYAQLWAMGRAAIPEILQSEGRYPYVSASDVLLQGKPFPPRPLTIEEIKEYVEWFAIAAKNALRAGFDGVEFHAANGYLIDQFIQDTSNRRTDEYGGSIENRCRFALEIIDAVAQAIGEARTGIRVSPWGAFSDMKMSDPRPTFSFIASEIAKRHPNFAFLHVVEPRVEGADDRVVLEDESNDFLREIWSPRPFISAGAYLRDSALQVSESKGDIIAFGRLFISNPDIVHRLQNDLPLVKGNRQTYYRTEGNPDSVGYIDYPFADGTDEIDSEQAAAGADNTLFKARGRG
ncbi:hypothetical protein PHLGIDRAFT_21746 [Phlebiopsis gigantea 11061_1 CR5-6]|uniref:NADH:flavin oxidoreductase/NADH oxidase N-terminal domain-containing protein n=1 Tax=Phlebiopsis gigantea (strain 11061_1 CR5-6) TaxID=745531 RepID=A0A0C3SF18_PHLG1|nr:hypothetical protein PHLGIDRAFT_21746 [Phlebiopsis gigantea 11061_1 CR5-6]